MRTKSVAELAYFVDEISINVKTSRFETFENEDYFSTQEVNCIRFWIGIMIEIINMMQKVTKITSDFYFHTTRLFLQVIFKNY